MLNIYSSHIFGHKTRTLKSYAHQRETTGSSNDSLQLRLFKMGTSLEGKHLLPEGANSFLYEQYLIVWKITYHIKWPPLNVTIFITHVRNLRNWHYANARCQVYLLLAYKWRFRIKQIYSFCEQKGIHKTAGPQLPHP